MTTTTDNETIDLRDEIEFLRQLVERLLTELKQAREARVDAPVYVPPQPIIIQQPVIRDWPGGLVESPPPWFQGPWYSDITGGCGPSIGNIPDGITASFNADVPQLQWATP